MSGGLAAAPVALEYGRNGEDPYRLDGVSAGTRTASAYTGTEGSYVDQTFYPERRRDMDVQPQQEQQHSFLDRQPADQRNLPAEQGVSSSDWIAPAAAGVGVAGIAAAAAADAHAEKEQGEIVMPADEEKPEVPEKSARRSSPPSESAVVVAVADKTATDPKTNEPIVVATAVAPIPSGHVPKSEELGGLEREGAHETGRIFPRVIRHDTDMSISQLHIPGKFPKQA